MKIYIDNDFKCHVNSASSFREIETDFFDGKCKNYIEGFRYLPKGETWTRADGQIFHGTMIWSFIDYHILEKFQEQYEELLTGAEMAYERGVNSI